LAWFSGAGRLSENSQWDERLLAEQLKELPGVAIEFSLEITGFDVGEIDLKIESLSLQRLS